MSSLDWLIDGKMDLNLFRLFTENYILSVSQILVNLKSEICMVVWS